MKREFIKEFSGRIIGTIDTDIKTGDQIAKNFQGVILGYYYAKQNITKDFSGRILAEGNLLSSLITKDANK